MLMVGLTGGIGAGKSTVTAVLAEAGAVIVDADRIAREIVEPGTPGLAMLVAEFGDDIVARSRAPLVPSSTRSGPPHSTRSPIR